MPLAPEAAALLASAPPRPERHTQSVEDNRRSLREAARLFAPGPELPEVRDCALATPVGDIPARIYRSGPGVSAALVYFHGGGWALGDLDTHDSICRNLAHDTVCTVISVDYRQPPEHRFPVALQDAVAAVAAVAEQAPQLQVDRRRLAVGGDSAGGSLAAAAAQQLAAEVELAHQLLLIPALDARLARWPSYEEFASGTPLSRRDMEWYYEQYCPEPALDDPRLSPLAARDLAGLPPATIVTAECDPLRDEGEAYADLLSRAQVPVELRRYKGMFHPFVLYGARLDAARDAQRYAASRLRKAFEEAVSDGPRRGAGWSRP
ncbi:alpha/beta hydrolase [Ornithinimicrobium pratense]|uniref:Alpha/beta hydrolase n=1 Tax=Ornithinimicrobium pratense TaxID=2593973 RepID=A0A5J6V9Z7_9MICO|nr:alpha/beta hydrolase [Ornithinimicrobium pratense]